MYTFQLLHTASLVQVKISRKSLPWMYISTHVGSTVSEGPVGLPKYCVRRSDTIELRVGGIRVLDTDITDRGTVNHYHHCSIHWRVRGSELHSGTGDVGGLDTGLAVRMETIILIGVNILVVNDLRLVLPH